MITPEYKIEIQNKLNNKVFLVYNKKDWEVLCLSLSLYCYTGKQRIFGDTCFKNTRYLRITSFLDADNLLKTGWGDIQDTEFYKDYEIISDFKPWLEIL